MTGHRVEWHLEKGYLYGSIVCDEPQGAACRTTCAKGVCEHTGCEHAEPANYCNIVEWISEGGGDAPAECYSGPGTQPADGPIVVEWDGDNYLWHYSDGAQA